MKKCQRGEEVKCIMSEKFIYFRKEGITVDILLHFF